MKRILSMQDLSCAGKCSLTVALPILSAMGLETAVLPTAVLSTHTAFSGFTFHDLTGDIPGILDHWSRQGFSFDTICTGYLGSVSQVRLAKDLFSRFPARRIVDPAMADHGHLYAGLSGDLPQKMAELCARADIILPNLTEACFLSGTPYQETFSEKEIREILKKLSGLGPATVVLTGVSLTKGKTGALVYEAEKDSLADCPSLRLPGSYHGTGDIFTAVFAGGVTRSLSAEKAARLAADFTLEALKKTMQDPRPHEFGVNFEEVLPWLIRKLALAR